jgi:hypothetical protein
MRSTGDTDGTLRVQECPSSFLNKGASGFRQLRWALSVPNEQPETVVFFKLHDLLAEGGLRDPQSLSGSREIQLIGQNTAAWR